MAPSKLWTLVLLSCLPVALSEALNAEPILNTSSSVGSLGNIDAFTFPTLGGASSGEALFAGSFAKASALLVYSAGHGTLVDAIDTSSPVGWSMEKSSGSFAGFGDFDIAVGPSKSGRLLAFVATVVSSDGSSYDGVFLQRPGAKASVPIATTEQSFAPIAAAFDGFSGVAVASSDNGDASHVAFMASAKGGSWQGVVLATLKQGQSTPELSVLVDTETSIPGAEDLKFKCLSDPVISDVGTIAFFGSHCTTSAASAMVRSQYEARSFFRTRRDSTHCLMHSKGAQSADVYPGIFAWSSSSGVYALADAATVVPGSAELTTKFVAFSNPSISSDGYVAFVAEDSLGNLGVYAATPQRQLKTVADTTTFVPGAGGQAFGDFPQTPSAGTAGLVLFYASATAGFTGVYEGSAAVQVVAPLLTLSDTVNGQPLIYIGFGANAYSEATDTFVSYLVLNSTLDGIWSFHRSASRVSEDSTLV